MTDWRRGEKTKGKRGGERKLGRKRRERKRGLNYNNVSQYMEPSQDTRCE